MKVARLLLYRNMDQDSTPACVILSKHPCLRGACLLLPHTSSCLYRYIDIDIAYRMRAGSHSLGASANSHFWKSLGDLGARGRLMAAALHGRIYSEQSYGATGCESKMEAPTCCWVGVALVPYALRPACVCVRPRSTGTVDRRSNRGVVSFLRSCARLVAAQ